MSKVGAPPQTSPGPLPLPELHQALAEGWISARYQPVVRIADRRPIGLEVLARAEHPSRGTLTPDLFIPAMEAAGLIWPLTQAVVRQALGAFDGARLAALGLTLAVNVSLDGLLRPDAAAWLLGACADAALAPERLIVELTESQEIDDPPGLRTAVARLRGAGFGLAIDDVGPAIRDHTPLLDMGFTRMKLDKALVAAEPADAAAQAFLALALRQARAAGMAVIAEGIETPATWQRMAALGVDYAQGYLIARPLPAAEVEAWCAAWVGQ